MHSNETQTRARLGNSKISDRRQRLFCDGAFSRAPENCRIHGRANYKCGSEQTSEATPFAHLRDQRSLEPGWQPRRKRHALHQPLMRAQRVHADALRSHPIHLAARHKPGEEITIDYQSTLHSNKKRCICGAPSCRGTINKTWRGTGKQGNRGKRGTGELSLFIFPPIFLFPFAPSYSRGKVKLNFDPRPTSVSRSTVPP